LANRSVQSVTRKSIAFAQQPQRMRYIVSARRCAHDCNQTWCKSLQWRACMIVVHFGFVHVCLHVCTGRSLQESLHQLRLFG